MSNDAQKTKPPSAPPPTNDLCAEARELVAITSPVFRAAERRRAAEGRRLRRESHRRVLAVERCANGDHASADIEAGRCGRCGEKV